jgi:Protein of unknown function (DUF4235)
MIAHTLGRNHGDEEASMSKKRSDSNGKMVAALATTGAVFLARKVVTMIWTRTTGKQPPTDPGDPSVSILQALSWAIIAGITIEAARVFVTRATARRPEPEAGAPESS